MTDISKKIKAGNFSGQKTILPESEQKPILDDHDLDELYYSYNDLYSDIRSKAPPTEENVRGKYSYAHNDENNFIEEMTTPKSKKQRKVEKYSDIEEGEDNSKLWFFDKDTLIIVLSALIIILALLLAITLVRK